MLSLELVLGSSRGGIQVYRIIRSIFVHLFWLKCLSNWELCLKKNHVQGIIILKNFYKNIYLYYKYISFIYKIFYRYWPDEFCEKKNLKFEKGVNFDPEIKVIMPKDLVTVIE